MFFSEPEFERPWGMWHWSEWGTFGDQKEAQLEVRKGHICLCLSEETHKPGGPFYLVSLPGE